MFTGIIEERGSVRRSGHRLAVECRTVVGDSSRGSSVAVNGVCLTVTDREAAGPDGEPGSLSFDLSAETMARSSLGRLRPGHAVNLERAVTLVTRLGGHLVQGHVDGIGFIETIEPEETGTTMAIRTPPGLARYIAEKGSIAVDGVSLTVAAAAERTFRVALVPYTLAATTLSDAAVGQEVNLEVDLLARYLEALSREVPWPNRA